ncbi:MAG: hypothetical protein KTQ49_02100 [Candidatus Omnitrophica bacterium]|nr:hypothetical protein [Candidatus Omnitrophota bacterium]
MRTKRTCDGLVLTVLLLTAIWGLSGCGPRPFKEYDENGKLQAEGYQKFGKLEGPYRAYYGSGILKTETIFKGGRVDGPFKTYHENGKIELEAFFRKGTPDGLFKEYDEKGKLKRMESIDETLKEAIKARLS